ncbi:amidohydrolase family protein [Hymenobacter profundi]|uniref:Amidohydrolase family protein n=1 Tax=Hymenobacter profundi TaxID=1982110 RepID=A0ABS6X1W7_9BACT|nr:amidohydrolase family protein [Hymenobacter profundi]MBW3129803.1 amidohydrolase family protein [Hymenobacter profundi]
MKKIALEEHFLAPAFVEGFKQHMRDLPEKAMQNILTRLQDFGEQRLAAMDAAGIERSFLSLTSPGVQTEPDTARAVRLAHETNDFLAEKIELHPTRFGGLAHLALQDPTAAADELERCVRQLGFRGAMINSHTNGHYLDEDQYTPFWERVQDLGVPVYLHPANSYQKMQLYEGHPELLGATWSWTVETATHALRLVFGGVFERFPKVQLILGHMGETLPYLLWRLDSRARLAGLPQGLTKLPSEYIKSNIVVTTTGVCADESLQCALAALGEDNVLFSVDYPFEESETASRWIEQAPLSDEVRAKVCHQNAARVLGL